MGIPNLADPNQGGQDGQSRCNLAMPELAIYFGYGRSTGNLSSGAWWQIPVYGGLMLLSDITT